jgi:hypothetical protein
MYESTLSLEAGRVAVMQWQSLEGLDDDLAFSVRS